MGTLNERTLVWAHRGASAYAPENTLEAFRLAVDMDADGVELDVHLTRDGAVVVCHDDRIDRTSDGTGAIADMTLAELRQYHFSGRFKNAYPDARIPTLQEVYETLLPSRLTVNVEIKASGADFVQKVLGVAEACGMRDRVIYSSFNHQNLKDALLFDPAAQTAPLYGEGLSDAAEYAKKIGCRALHPHFNELYHVPAYLEKAHALGIRVHPWTVDDESNLRKLTEMGVDALISNRPDIALKFVK